MTIAIICAVAGWTLAVLQIIHALGAEDQRDEARAQRDAARAEAVAWEERASAWEALAWRRDAELRRVREMTPLVWPVLAPEADGGIDLTDDEFAAFIAAAKDRDL